MKVPSCACLECLWEREHPDWVAFWCIRGPVNKLLLGLDFSVRAKRVACTCHFPTLFPSENCLVSDSMGNYRRSFVSRPIALNDESVGSNKVDLPLIPPPKPFMIELSDSDGDPPTWRDAIDANFVQFLRKVICPNPTYVIPADSLF